MEDIFEILPIRISGDQIGHKHCTRALCRLVIDVQVRGQRQELSCQWMGVSWVTILGVFCAY